ncbi:MAG: Peptidase C25 gingipain (Fragment) [uncultured Thiotrichaceae bacterium]|uniref:Peptidase C25 gingipain n=1 Tax=uncultured Thiotrichaceae bacterium TaxID=298394 RepID=A0A6S6SC02_9GAMM
MVNNKYPLIIISPRGFNQALAPLVEHKNSTGMPCLLVSLEDIQDRFYGKDFPEQVKRAIAHYNQENKSRYFMLVGDTDIFPVRYIRGTNTEWNTRYYPSDLYYADLYDNQGVFDDWDIDDDGYHGTTNFTGGDERVNVDKINLYPDVSVGRVPASSPEEVTNYINKVIGYEYGAWRSSWKKQAMIVSDHGTGGAFAHKIYADEISDLLKNFTTFKLYQNNQPYKDMDLQKRAMVITGKVNDGIGVLAHLGHGNPHSWAHFLNIQKLSDLSNSKYPIVSTIACLTANFHYGPEIFQQDNYLTTDGNVWFGQGAKKANRPMPASIQPGRFDVESMAEGFLVKHKYGAVAYMGSVAKGEHGGAALQKYFIEFFARQMEWHKLGDIWANAMRKFIDNEALPGMGFYYAYLHLHKVILFGDPSLRVGGIPRWQKHHFSGEWDICHDGWRGKIKLTDAGDHPIDGPFYNLKGEYINSKGDVYEAYATVISINSPRDLNSWHDHQMKLVVKFDEEQEFLLYLHTQSKNEMSGVTYWRNQPFGVAMFRPGMTQLNGVRDSKMVEPWLLSGEYQMSHDGWRGRLNLAYDFSAKGNKHRFTGNYITADGENLLAYGETNQEQPHILKLFIDFNKTNKRADDQKFDLYFYTQTKDGMAGIAHWNNIPFGARLTKLSPLHLTNMEGKKGSIRHFQLYIPSGSSRITFKMTGGIGDPDIYVRFKDRPSLTEYDYRPYISGSEENIVINSPSSGFIYAMVHGYTDFKDIELEVSLLH